ncbi:MAG: hypothetical protein WDM77_03205 [Steroidobacteraceae bacterium]
MDLAWLRRRIASTDPEVIARWERLERALETGLTFKRRVVEQLRPTLLDNLAFTRRRDGWWKKPALRLDLRPTSTCRRQSRN